MKVHWTESAQGHLDSIHEYIARNSPDQIDVIAVIHGAKDVLNRELGKF